MTVEKRWLILSAQEVAFAIHDREVLIHFDLAQSSAGLMPEIELGLRLSPSEARVLAQVLARKADEVEAAVDPK